MTDHKGRNSVSQEYSATIINSSVLVEDERETRRTDGILGLFSSRNPKLRELLADAAPHRARRCFSIVCAWRAPRLFLSKLSLAAVFHQTFPLSLLLLFFIPTASLSLFRHSSSFTPTTNQLSFASLFKQPASIVYSPLLFTSKSNSSVALRLPHSFNKPSSRSICSVSLSYRLSPSSPSPRSTPLSFRPLFSLTVPVLVPQTSRDSSVLVESLSPTVK